MGNYFSTPSTESITIINEIDHVHVVMSESQQQTESQQTTITNENKNVNEEKNIILKIYDKEELNVSAADNALDSVAAATVTTLTSIICKKNIKKNKKNKKKLNKLQV